MLKTISVLSVFLVSALAFADNPKDRYATFPFSLSLDMDLVYEVTSSKPENLLSIINRQGVKVLRVVTKNPTIPLNPILKNLEIASDELIKSSDFGVTQEGVMLLRWNPCCDLKQDVLLIRDTSSSYSLMHEFFHFALRHKFDPKWKDIEINTIMALRRLQTYGRELLFDPNKLLKPTWRRDILVAQRDLLDMLYVRFQIGQSQEVIIEKVMSRYIDPSNPYYNPTRIKQGSAYGVAMLNNMIDIFGALFESITWTKNTVSGFDHAVKNNLLKLQTGDVLTEQQTKHFVKTSSQLLRDLDPIRIEIEKLKEFYVTCICT